MLVEQISSLYRQLGKLEEARAEIGLAKLRQVWVGRVLRSLQRKDPTL